MTEDLSRVRGALYGAASTDIEHERALDESRRAAAAARLPHTIRPCSRARQSCAGCSGRPWCAHVRVDGEISCRHHGPVRLGADLSEEIRRSWPMMISWYSTMSFGRAPREYAELRRALSQASQVRQRASLNDEPGGLAVLQRIPS